MTRNSTLYGTHMSLLYYNVLYTSLVITYYYCNCITIRQPEQASPRIHYIKRLSCP